jgi:Fe-S-cluster containining protein
MATEGRLVKADGLSDNLTPVFDDDVVRISNYSNLEQAQSFTLPLYGRRSPDGSIISAGKQLKTKRNGECIFLREGSCEIYPVRPRICRAYPFWFDRRETLHVDGCPGTGMGEKLSIKTAREMIEAAWEHHTLIAKTESDLLRLLVRK